jgi:hypothetical protein
MAHRAPEPVDLVGSPVDEHAIAPTRHFVEDGPDGVADGTPDFDDDRRGRAS